MRTKRADVGGLRVLWIAGAVLLMLAVVGVFWLGRLSVHLTANHSALPLFLDRS